MRKIFAILLAVMLIASMTVSAYAVTPPLNVPDLPEIPNISGSVKIDVTPAVNKWLDEHPINIDYSKIKLPIKIDFSKLWGWN